MVLEESSLDTLDRQKDKRAVLEQIKPETSPEAKVTKAEASCFGLITRRQGSPENATMLGKRKAAGKEEGHVRGGATPYGCHRRESAGADGALWVSLARSRS